MSDFEHCRSEADRHKATLSSHPASDPCQSLMSPLTIFKSSYSSAVRKLGVRLET
jgi:hypothetical protein